MANRNTVKIDRICAWCDTKMGTKMVDPLSAAIGRKTHGICPTCMARHIHQMEEGDAVQINDLPWAIGEIKGFIHCEQIGSAAEVHVPTLGLIVRRCDGLTKVEQVEVVNP